MTVGTKLTYCQDVIFSNLNENDTYLNPANSFNGLTTNKKGSIDLQFRDQWSSITNNNTYATIKLQTDYNVYKSKVDNWNIGAILLSDRSNFGLLKQTTVRLLGSYTRRLSGESFRNSNSHYLTGGFSYGLAQTSLDIGALWFGRQYDTNLLTINTALSNGELLNSDPVSYQDINLGLRWTYYLDDKNIYSAALALDHINSPLISNNDPSINLTSRITAQFNASLGIDETLAHKPSLSIIVQNPFFQIVPGYQLVIGLDNLESDFAIALGLHTRLTNSINGILIDAAIFNLGLSGRTWNMNFSFDLATSEIRNFNSGTGAIELSLGYRILKRD